MRGPLNEVVTAIRERHPNALGQLREGLPWREIVAAATESGADLVVVGSHGRRGAAHFLLGSVAERVVRASPARVLTVPGSWFDDRAHAGRELARAFESLGLSAPAVLALSAGGVVIGTEVSRTFSGASLDVLLTRTLCHRGAILGGLCEDGTVRLVPQDVSAAVSAEEGKEILSTARMRLHEQAFALRGPRWIDDVRRRAVILVDDELIEPWRALAAAEVVGEMGPARIVVATPVASESAVAFLKKEINDVVVLHALRAGVEAAAAYRDFRKPQEKAIADLLRRRPDAAE
jgi:putative phosphoribosyl transferase